MKAQLEPQKRGQRSPKGGRCNSEPLAEVGATRCSWSGTTASRLRRWRRPPGPDRVDDEGAVKALRREAGLLERLDHPVLVHGLGLGARRLVSARPRRVRRRREPARGSSAEHSAHRRRRRPITRSRSSRRRRLPRRVARRAPRRQAEQRRAGATPCASSIWALPERSRSSHTERRRSGRPPTWLPSNATRARASWASARPPTSGGSGRRSITRSPGTGRSRGRRRAGRRPRRPLPAARRGSVADPD